MTFPTPGSTEALAASVRTAFAGAYGHAPRTLARAPGRVNLIGEHTDYNAGPCLPVALPHSTIAALTPRTDRLLRISSVQQPGPWEGSIDDLAPGSVDGWAAYVAGVVWALDQAGHEVPGLDVLVDSTVPVGAGLSSSAALECSVAVGVTDLLGLSLDDTLRRDLVTHCIRAETEMVGAPTGGMDQTVSLLATPGAALLIDFADASTRAVPLPLHESGMTLLVTDTRVSHALVDGGYAARRADCEQAAAILGVATLREAALINVDALTDERVRRRARHVVTEIARVGATVTALGTADWTCVGEIFAASHASMRDDFEISCPELDIVVRVAGEAGAVASRMTGGGFGGSAVSVVPQDQVGTVCAALDDAFRLAALQPPTHLLADPSGAAERLHSFSARTMVAISSSSSREKTLPVGLCGLLTMRHRVLGVIAPARTAALRRHSPSPSTYV